MFFLWKNIWSLNAGWFGGGGILAHIPPWVCTNSWYQLPLLSSEASGVHTFYLNPPSAHIISQIHLHRNLHPALKQPPVNQHENCSDRNLLFMWAAQGHKFSSQWPWSLCTAHARVLMVQQMEGSTSHWNDNPRWYVASNLMNLFLHQFVLHQPWRHHMERQTLTWGRQMQAVQPPVCRKAQAPETSLHGTGDWYYQVK